MYRFLSTLCDGKKLIKWIYSFFLSEGYGPANAERLLFSTFLAEKWNIRISEFLAACYAILHPALSVRPLVRQSVCPSVTLYFFGVNGGFGLIAPAQMFH